MALYDYKCLKCGSLEEKEHSINESPIYTCGVCGYSLKKAFAATRTIFRGGGFYTTDKGR